MCEAPGGAAQSHFADLLEIEPISVSRLLDRMEVSGWVTRAADPKDRRVRRVFPTPKALDTFGKFQPIVEEVYAEALVGQSGDQHRALLDALGTIVTNLAAKLDPAETIDQKELT